MLDFNNSYINTLGQKKLSICMISDDFLPAMTGVGVHLKLITPELVRRGHKVCVITSRRKGEPEVDHWEGVTIYRVFTLKMYGFYQALPSASTISSILKIVKPDLIHHHYAGMMMRLVCKIAKSFQIRQVSTYHFSAEVLTQPLPMRPLRGLIRKMMVKYNNYCDLILAPSQNIANQITKEGVHSNVRYITNPVAFSDNTTVVPAERTSGFTILYAGRLGKEKNIELLIKSFADLLTTQPEAVLWIAGRGPQGLALENLCQQLKIKDQVKFLGFLDHPTLAKYYAACDTFVLPSLEEVQPLVVMEAMWFAKPVIVTSAIAAAEEMVEQGINGFIVNPHSIQDLANRLNVLATEPNLRASQGAASRERANNFRPELVLNAIEDAYHQLLSAERKSHNKRPEAITNYASINANNG